MIETVSLRLEIVSDFSKTFSARELANQHCHELTPAPERAKFLTCVMNGSEIFKIMSRNKCSNLVKDCFIMCHGSDLFVSVIFLAISLCYKKLSEALII